MIDHVNMRRGPQVPIVGARQGGISSRKYDVVAVAPEADEALRQSVVFIGGESGEPLTAFAHLYAVRGVSESSQPRASMRRRDGHDAMDLAKGPRRGKPVPSC